MTSLTNSKKKERPKSQAQLKTEIKAALSNREMVTLYGNQPNGKTHLFWQVWCQFMIGIEGLDINTVKPGHDEEPTLHILPNVEISGASDKVTKDRIMRQVLQTYQVKNAAHMSQYQMRYEFRKLLTTLDQKNIIPVIAMDNVELMPPKGFGFLKGFNELRDKKNRHVGFGILASGEFRQRKLPHNFWQHCTDIQIGKINVEEMEEFIRNIIGPRFAAKFTTPVMKRLIECRSTLEMATVIKRIAREMSEGTLEGFDESTVGEYSEAHHVQQMRLAA